MDWGIYEAAVRRWEAVLGRPAPHPTQTGKHGRPVLAPPFVEHLMGLPTGWVTDLPLPRTAQLRALGNGVVPQQAAHAFGLLLDDLAELLGLNPRTGDSATAGTDPAVTAGCRVRPVRERGHTATPGAPAAPTAMRRDAA